MTRFSSIMHAERVSQVAREQAEEDKKPAPPGGRVLSRTTLSHLGLAAPAWYMRREKIQGLTSAPTASAENPLKASAENPPDCTKSFPEPVAACRKKVGKAWLWMNECDGGAQATCKQYGCVWHPETISFRGFCKLANGDCHQTFPIPVAACLKKNNNYWLNECESTCKDNGCVWIPGNFHSVLGETLGDMLHNNKCALAGSEDPVIHTPSPIAPEIPDLMCAARKSEADCVALNCVWEDAPPNKPPPGTKTLCLRA